MFSARWAISLSIILGSLTNSVMMGSVNVAVPAMMTHLRADVTQIQWVLSAFMIARTIVMPTLGWIGGRVGNRRLYLTSLSLYMVASMLCGLAWDLHSMIFFRVFILFMKGFVLFFFWTGTYAGGFFLATIEDTAGGNPKVDWPEDSIWVIGLFLGIDLLIHGWWLVMLSISVKSMPTTAGTT